MLIAKGWRRVRITKRQMTGQTAAELSQILANGSAHA